MENIMEKVETIVGELLTNIPNFIESDFIDNGNDTYTLCANFEHPAYYEQEDYAEINFLFAKVTFDKNLNILCSGVKKSYKALDCEEEEEE